jgi:hypothetical protein
MHHAHSNVPSRLLKRALSTRKRLTRIHVAAHRQRILLPASDHDLGGHLCGPLSGARLPNDGSLLPAPRAACAHVLHLESLF